MNITISRIYLMLGNECNLQCKYCLQHDIVNDQVCHTINPAVFKYIANAQKQQQRPIGITFFGGEPLIFWEQVKEFVLRLSVTGVKFGMVTNGKCLTQEKVDFINENNIGVGLSWDGYNTLKTRGYDVIKDKKDLLTQIKSLNVTGVVSQENYPLDFVCAVDEFDAEYYKKNQRHIGINMDLIMDNCGNCGDLTEIDYDKWRTQMEMLKEKAQKSQGEEAPYTTGQQLVYHIESLAGRKVDVLSAKCGNGITTLNIDMQGNLYQCHNTHRKIGTIFEDSLTPIRRMMLIDPTHRNYRTMCKDCSVLPYCRNGCMLMDQDTRKRYYCELAHATYEPFLKD